MFTLPTNHNFAKHLRIGHFIIIILMRGEGGGGGGLAILLSLNFFHLVFVQGFFFTFLLCSFTFSLLCKIFFSTFVVQILFFSGNGPTSSQNIMVHLLLSTYSTLQEENLLLIEGNIFVTAMLGFT